MPYSVHYSFSQKFSVSAEAAFAWCTDYQPNDLSLLGNRDAKRAVTWITRDTVLVKDTFSNSDGPVAKEKLVQLYPERLMWISTHISGPNKYSQFIYQIVAQDAGKSRLDFSALHVERKENLTQQELKQLSKDLPAGDAAIWRFFAKAMEMEYTK